MENNRDVGILGALTMLLILALLLPIRFLLLPPTRSDLVGFIIGVVLSGAMCAYLGRIWDPVRLQPKSLKSTKVDGRWLPIVVIGGVVTARLTGQLLNTQQGAVFGACLMTVTVITTCYLLIQAWRHRPKY